MCVPLLVAGCVDQEEVGVSTSLRVASAPSEPVHAGGKVEVVFQALDDHQAGVPDLKVEVVVTNPARLEFATDQDTTRIIVSTGRSTSVNDAVLNGAVAVDFVVPKDATPGAVSVVASLEGDRNGSSSKTRWVNITVEGEGGASGDGTGGASTGGGDAGGASAGGAAGAGGVAGSSPTAGGAAGASAAGSGGSSGEGGASGAAGTTDAGSAGT